MSTIVFVEKDKNAVSAFRRRLQRGGYEVFVVEDERGVLSLKPSLVILGQGRGRVLPCLRKSFQGAIFVFAEEIGNEDIASLVLGQGADDYLSKETSPEEFYLRVRNTIRRYSDHVSRISRIGDLEVDLDSRLVRVRGKEMRLTPIQFALLAHLARHQNEVQTRMRLFDAVWSVDSESFERAVDTHICNLRAKLEQEESSVRIVTIYSIGYKLEAA